MKKIWKKVLASSLAFICTVTAGVAAIVTGGFGLFNAAQVEGFDYNKQLSFGNFFGNGIMLTASAAEANTGTSVFESVVSDAGTVSSLTAVNMASTPFAYRDLTLYENQTVVKIGIPVKTVTDYTADSLFTVYVVSYDEPLTTFTQVSEHKLTIPANTFTSNTVNEWYYFDTNIVVGENQTLGFTSSSDTIRWGFLSSSNVQYALYNKLFSGYGTSAYGLFDVSTKVELNYTLEEYIKNLEIENSKVYANTMLAGKKISILGDSISTLEGISDNVAYNTTLSPNQSRYYAKDVAYTTTEATLELTSWEDTYWGQTVNDLNLELCVNNSWRGTSVSTARGASSCTSGTRATQLHNDNENINPDIIVIYIGTNDKSASAPVLGYDSIDDLYDGTSYTADCSYFDVAYATMVLKVKNKYPNADIYLCNLIYNDTLGQSYNESIEKIATEFDCNIVDFSTLVPVWSWSGHTMDGLHPNKDGFDLMADILTRTIQETFMQN